MAKILFIEDDQELCITVKDYLTNQTHSVDVVHDGESGLYRLKFYEFDLIILDLTLPDMDGYDLLREYRAQGGKAPVLVLTGRREVADKESLLDAGADDYLTKPFQSRELSARLRALMRRPALAGGTLLTAGALVLDPVRTKLTRNGEEIPLQPKEFALLEFFMRHPDQVFSAEAIMNRVWPSDSDTSPDVLRVHLTKLRSKIDEPGKESIIRTLRGAGYKLQPPE